MAALALPAPGPLRDWEHALRDLQEAERIWLAFPVPAPLDVLDAYLSALRRLYATDYARMAGIGAAWCQECSDPYPITADTCPDCELETRA